MTVVAFVPTMLVVQALFPLDVVAVTVMTLVTLVWVVQPAAPV